VDRHAWIEGFPGAVTVCDATGRILEMNQKAIRTFADDGGAALIGKNLLDCHPEPSRSKVAGLLERREANVYTIEKRGVRKLIYQSPWYEGGEYRGLVELSLDLPAEMPHFVRG
jgi:transcriptional regulator with PAS, ATPase and Fis domain